MTTPDADEQLVRQAQADPEAFGVLYSKYLSLVYSYVYYRVSSIHDTEDLVARIFYQALAHLKDYRPKGLPFSAWLLRIAHNLVANWHRSQSRRRTFSLDDAFATADERVDVVAKAEAREEEQVLRATIAQLSPRRQQLILLKYVEGMSNAQIGTVMGCSEGAVKALLHRTLLDLREALLAKGLRR